MTMQSLPRHHLGSLRARLLLLVLLAALPFLALIVVNTLRTRDLARKTAAQEAILFTRLAAARQDALFKSTQDLLITLAQIPEARGDDPALCAALMTKLQLEYVIYNNLGVTDDQGNLWCSAITPPAPVNLADRSWFSRVSETHLPQVGEFQIGRNSGMPSIVIAAPVFETDATFIREFCRRYESAGAIPALAQYPTAVTLTRNPPDSEMPPDSAAAA